MPSATYFLNLLEDKDRRLNTKLTLRLILRVNLRLEGYSIWSASSIAPCIKEEREFNRTSYKRRFDNYSGHEHLAASMQLRVYSKDTFEMESRRTRRRLQKYSGACSTRLRRARELIRHGATGLCT
jgi:hypothetical protein